MRRMWRFHVRYFRSGEGPGWPGFSVRLSHHDQDLEHGRQGGTSARAGLGSGVSVSDALFPALRMILKHPYLWRPLKYWEVHQCACHLRERRTRSRQTDVRAGGRRAHLQFCSLEDNDMLGEPFSCYPGGVCTRQLSMSLKIDGVRRPERDGICSQGARQTLIFPLTQTFWHNVTILL